MKQYYIEINLYSTKNRAHESLQSYVVSFQRVLTDATEKIQIKNEIKNKIKEVNQAHPRCKDITLSGWCYSDETIAVEGNFEMTFKEVKGYRLTQANSKS